MKRGFFCLMMPGFIVISIAGCYYDKAELVYPAAANCDTSAVRYSSQIVSILTNNCYSCHSGTASNGSGIKLDNYSVLKARADNGILLSAITHSGSASPMPKNGPRLSDCNIAIIRTWLRSGAPNN